MAGGIYEQLDWPDSRSDYVQVCDGCHTAIWSTRWNEETSDGFDAFLARNGWHAYTHADQEVYAQLTARERMAANLLLTAA